MALITTETNLDYLITYVRLNLGDIDETKWSDAAVRTALVQAVLYLQHRWNSRYTIDATTYDAVRSTTYTFEEDDPPIIQGTDAPAVVMQAIWIICSGKVFDSDWVSWRDDEISFTNLTGGRLKKEQCNQYKEWLDEFFTHRLAGAVRQSLPGFIWPENIREG